MQKNSGDGSAIEAVGLAVRNPVKNHTGISAYRGGVTGEENI